MSNFLPRTIQAARLITLFIRYAVYYRKCAARTPIPAPDIVHHSPHLDHAGATGESALPARLLRAWRHTLPVLAGLRAQARPVRYGSRHREGVPPEAPPDRRSWNRHWKDPCLPFACPADRSRAPPAPHHRDWHEEPTGTAILP